MTSATGLKVLKSTARQSPCIFSRAVPGLWLSVRRVVVETTVTPWKRVASSARIDFRLSGRHPVGAAAVDATAAGGGGAAGGAGGAGLGSGAGWKRVAVRAGSGSGGGAGDGARASAVLGADAGAGI